MTRLDEEIAFLRRFGKRFSKKETYLAAMKDMFDEGIITKKAYEAIIKEKGANVMVPPKVLAKKVVKVMDEPKEIDRDPCSRGGYSSYRTC